MANAIKFERDRREKDEKIRGIEDDIKAQQAFEKARYDELLNFKKNLQEKKRGDG